VAAGGGGRGGGAGWGGAAGGGPPSKALGNTLKGGAGLHGAGKDGHGLGDAGHAAPRGGQPWVRALGRDFQEPPVQGETGSRRGEETWAVVQPHTFSRVEAFHGGFVESVRGADRALVMDVFAAREEGDPVSTSQWLVANMNDDGDVPLARYTGDVESTVGDIQRQLNSVRQQARCRPHAAPRTVRIAFMGAGDVVEASGALARALRAGSSGAAADKGARGAVTVHVTSGSPELN